MRRPHLLCTAQMCAAGQNKRGAVSYTHLAGAIFIGENSSEPLGDYFAGPNHILPTNGTAKFFSPLSVDDAVLSIYLSSKRTAMELACAVSDSALAN